MSDSVPERPDILLVVMDCARADVFAELLADPTALPFLHELLGSGLSFPGAIAPSSWTVPSHASLFTGLYPWEHGAHNKSSDTLATAPETIAGHLGRAGYATGCFSANAYVQPATGLTHGFSEVQWGGDREFFLRFLPRRTPSRVDLGGPQAALFGRFADSPRASPFWYGLVGSMVTLPAFWDATNRLGGHVRGTRPEEVAQVAPWIEASVDAWLAQQPTDRPIFTFVNLLEAHEPYLADAGRSTEVARWIRYARANQDPRRWLRGTWVPGPTDLDVIRANYRKAFRTIDGRLRGIVEAFRRRGRWKNTVLVLTSDHGQAFLEHEILFHRLGVGDELVRIPLWLLGPGIRPGSVSNRWASLLDVPRTVVELAGGTWFGNPGARSLLRLADAPEDRVVHSMNDGLRPKEAPEMPADRRALLDRFEIASFRGELKLVASPTGAPASFRVLSGEPRRPEQPSGGGPIDPELERAGRAALADAQARLSGKVFEESVERRIAGWGY